MSCRCLNPLFRLDLWFQALLLLLPAVLVWPFLSSTASPGDDRIRNTIRLSLAYYALALNAMLWLRRSEWREGGLARAWWTLAWLAYVTHVAMAFHYYHGWSHAHAVEHVREVSGAGEGLFVSYFFTLVWTADVLSWWLWPGGYAHRPPWVGWTLHGFMLFIVFNGTVVYEEGPIRWAGAAGFAELAVMAWVSRFTWRRHQPGR